MEFLIGNVFRHVEFEALVLTRHSKNVECDLTITLLNYLRKEKRIYFKGLKTPKKENRRRRRDFVSGRHLCGTEGIAGEAPAL